MPIVTVGIDLAKNVFAIHGVDEAGKVVLRKPRVMRDRLAAVIAQLPPCLIGMEACSGAHHWARVFQQHGHTVLVAIRSDPDALNDWPAYSTPREPPLFISALTPSRVTGANVEG